MLIQFSIENFRSIKNRITFSMLASSDKSMEDNSFKVLTLNNDRLLRTAAIYGANASGKSNIINAISFLKKSVTSSHKSQKGIPMPFDPFRLDEKSIKSPSQFEIIFIKNNIKYIYGLSVKEKVIKEYLYYYPKGKKAMIFKRNNTKNYKFSIDEKEQKFYAEKTPENVLYLSRATQLNYSKTSQPFEWFDHDLRIIGPLENPVIHDFTASLLENKKNKKLILKALSTADMSIDDIFTSRKKVSLNDLPKHIPEKIAKILFSEKEDWEELIVKTKHKNQIFNFNDESEGTKKFFSLIGPWIDSLRNGYIVFVDELDTKLHPILNIFLIKLFQDSTQNIKNAQLIFATHNVNLLDQNLFRRDQIWFTEKIPEENRTDLYSLVEYRPRKDKNLRKGYLAGRYGALPYISEEGIF